MVALDELLFFTCWAFLWAAELVLVCTECGRGRANTLLLPVVELELLADGLMPLDHLWVWFCGECLARNRLWKHGPIRAEDVPSRNSILEIGDMLVGV